MIENNKKKKERKKKDKPMRGEIITIIDLFFLSIQLFNYECSFFYSKVKNTVV